MRILNLGSLPQLRSLALVPLAAVLIFASSTADAHRPGYDHYRPSYQAQRRVYVQRPAVPGWLRSNHDFLRWYRLTSYSPGIDVSWRRVYHRYERDHRYHRSHKQDRRDHRKQSKKRQKHRRH